MNPITHLLAGWGIANLDGLDKKERAAVTVAGIIPDVDALGLFAERLTLDSDRPLLWWTDYHHVLAHNIGFGLFVAAACFAVSSKRWTAAMLGFAAFNAHILMDIAGSGGPGGEHWPIPYLLPFTGSVWLEWSGQWLVDAWQNVLITAVLLSVTFVLARSRGYSVLEMVSSRADAGLIAALRRRFPLSDD